MLTGHTAELVDAKPAMDGPGLMYLILAWALAAWFLADLVDSGAGNARSRSTSSSAS